MEDLPPPPPRRPSTEYGIETARVCVRVPGRARVCVGVRLGVVEPPAVRHATARPSALGLGSQTDKLPFVSSN